MKARFNRLRHRDKRLIVRAVRETKQRQRQIIIGRETRFKTETKD